jgi:hypothetical protein
MGPWCLNWIKNQINHPEVSQTWQSGVIFINWGVFSKRRTGLLMRTSNLPCLITGGWLKQVQGILWYSQHIEATRHIYADRGHLPCADVSVRTCDESGDSHFACPASIITSYKVELARAWRVAEASQQKQSLWAFDAWFQRCTPRCAQAMDKHL